MRLAAGGERMRIGRPVKRGSFPWYRPHRRAALITGCVLFATVNADHLIPQGTREAVEVLYSLPIALLVVSFGVRSGSSGGDYRETDLELQFVRAVH